MGGGLCAQKQGAYVSHKVLADGSCWRTALLSSWLIDGSSAGLTGSIHAQDTDVYSAAAGSPPSKSAAQAMTIPTSTHVNNLPAHAGQAIEVLPPSITGRWS